MIDEARREAKHKAAIKSIGESNGTIRDVKKSKAKNAKGPDSWIKQYDWAEKKGEEKDWQLRERREEQKANVLR